MLKKLIMLVLVCILFPAVVLANQSQDKVPCLGDLNWGESSYTVSQKYRLTQIPSFTYDRTGTVCSVSLDNPYIYGVRVMPTATMIFTNDKLYLISFTFSMYENDTEYKRIRKIFIEQFGEPSKTATFDGRSEYTLWDKDVFSITLTMSSISFSHTGLSEEAEKASDEAQGKNITDWSSYVH